jgi:hypothetical protein
MARYSVKSMSNSVGCFNVERDIVEADTAAEALEKAGKTADLFDHGGSAPIDTRDWEIKPCSDGNGGMTSAMLAPKDADDEWGGDLVVVADLAEDEEE